MIRNLALALLTVIAVQTAALANEVALSNPTANPSTAGGKVLGLHNRIADTYGVDLTAADGVSMRDVFSIRRGGKVVGEAMVVYVCGEYSLVTVKGNARLRKGDDLVYVRHAEVPRTRVPFVPGETIIVRERDTARTLDIPSGSFSSSVSFSSTANFRSTTSFTSTVSYAPATGNTSFAGPTFSMQMPGFSWQGYSSPNSFAPSTSYRPSVPYTSTVRYGAGGR